MNKVYVSILSDHIIPNYIYFKEKDDGDMIPVFIVTDQVAQRRGDYHLEGAMGFAADDVERVHVSNDNYKDILEALEAADFDPKDEYVVNITGGTKIMALAVVDFFRKLNPKTNFVYLAYGTNKFYDLDTNSETLIKYRMNLREYFALYGMKCASENPSEDDCMAAKDLFYKLKKVNFNLKRVEETNDPQNNSFLHPDEKKFYGGAWFEAYVYDRIKRELKLGDDSVACSLKIYRDNSRKLHDNEIDVAFMKDNALHIIECKVAMVGEGDARATIDKYLYKLAAIAKDLGLRINSYIFTLHYMGMFNETERQSIDKRRSILGVKGIMTSDELRQRQIPL